MEHQGIADEWLNKAKQQLAEAKRRADEAAKQMEEVKVREEAIRIQAQMMAKHSEELSVVAIARAEKAEQVAAEKVRESIARAEIAEQHSAQKIGEVEKRVQTAVEYAVQLEQKFMDAMEGCTTIGMRQQLNQELKRLTHISRTNGNCSCRGGRTSGR